MRHHPFATFFCLTILTFATNAFASQRHHLTEMRTNVKTTVALADLEATGALEEPPIESGLYGYLPPWMHISIVPAKRSDYIKSTTAVAIARPLPQPQLELNQMVSAALPARKPKLITVKKLQPATFVTVTETVPRPAAKNSEHQQKQAREQQFLDRLKSAAWPGST